jgi:ataxia telangiectasia mutated family protein
LCTNYICRESLTDKAYHKIFEGLFQAVLTEKHIFLAARKNTQSSATTRLTACADALKVVVETGATQLKIKTVEAIAEHITQTLPNADSGYCKPLLQPYIKALGTLFNHQVNVERLKSSIWFDVVDFFLEGINQYLACNEGGSSSLSRSYPGGVNLLSGKSVTSSGQTENRQRSLTRQNVEDLFPILLLFVSASRAPLSERYHMVADTTMRFLQSQGSNASQVHQRAFSTLNAVLSFSRIDHISHTQSVAQDAIPVISRFWQGKAVAKDEMLNSVRDETLILLFNVHLHLERSLLDEDTSDLLLQVEDLLKILRADYARRSDRDQLQLDDLEMSDFGAKSRNDTPFGLRIFKLRPHNPKAERNWAHLQIVGMLERLVGLDRQLKSLTVADGHGAEADEHPRKRQRTVKPSDHLLNPLRSGDERMKTAALQMLPFVLQNCQLPESLLVELLALLQTCAGDKRGSIGSWALLAIAR